jgi:predicted RNase H-like nuclease (RuvC/YqgF family)
MLLTQFLSNFANAPKWARINVESVENYGLAYKITTEETVEDAAAIIQNLKEDLDSSDKQIKKLEEDLWKEELKNNELEKQIGKLEDSLKNHQISPTDTLGDLIDRNELQAKKIAELQESLNKFHRRYEDDQQEIKDLRARKNKASVKRCLTTGWLMANFDGVDYILEKTN